MGGRRGFLLRFFQRNGVILTNEISAFWGKKEALLKPLRCVAPSTTTFSNTIIIKAINQKDSLGGASKWLRKNPGILLWQLASIYTVILRSIILLHWTPKIISSFTKRKDLERCMLRNLDALEEPPLRVVIRIRWASLNIYDELPVGKIGMVGGPSLMWM